MQKEILVRDDPIPGFAGLVRAGPLLFTAGCDGYRDIVDNRIDPQLSGNAAAQSIHSYRKIERLLANAGAKPSSVARIDHFTSSQDWLEIRSVIRAQVFGRPAPHASTGVAAKMAGINMLTTAAIAAADASDHLVILGGDVFGTPRIATAVKVGPLIFLSGVRGIVDPRDGSRIDEETPAAFPAQVGLCYEMIGEALQRCGLSGERVVRVDTYARDRNRLPEERALRAKIAPSMAAVSSMMALPLGMRGEVEITVIAAANGHPTKTLTGPRGEVQAVSAGGFVFIGACAGAEESPTGVAQSDLAGQTGGQIDAAIAALDARLTAMGSDLSRLVRLEVYLRDIYAERLFLEKAAPLLSAYPPVLLIAGAELEGINEVQLCAIAV
jgi:enamine deaminase RidA (YjgF/YER057c/UK114 family)